mgnify:CR=1
AKILSALATQTLGRILLKIPIGFMIQPEQVPILFDKPVSLNLNS